MHINGARQILFVLFILNGHIYIFHEANAYAFPGAVYSAVVYSAVALFYCLSTFKPRITGNIK